MDPDRVLGSVRADPLYGRVHRTVREFGMTEQGGAVLAALSGGADSVCMLLILAAMREEEGFRLRALHVHHGLRESAEEDLSYSEWLCGRLDIPFAFVREDVLSIAGRRGTGIEETAREVRYEALERCAQEWDPACRIAVAHHLEDQAETVLFHLVRGSSLRGLGGIRPVSGRIIRPLLFEERAQIESCLRSAGTAWRTDETNADTRYARNLLREEILPLLERVNSGARRHIARAAVEAAETEDYLQKVTAEACRRCTVSTKAGPALSLEALGREEALVQKRILYRALADKAGGEKDIQAVHVETLRGLLAKGGEARLDLPGDVRAVRSGGMLRLMAGRECEEAVREAAQGWPEDASGYCVEVFSFDGDMGRVPRNKYTKWFDYDKIATFPVFRTRKSGDRITVTDGGRSKTLARWMIDEKIPRMVRDRICFPAAEAEVMWIPGCRISAAFKVEPQTRRILQITWSGNGDAGKPDTVKEQDRQTGRMTKQEGQ